MRASHSAEDVFGGGGRSDLATKRVADALQEFDMGAVELTGSLTDPEHVSGAVVPVAGEGVLAGEGLFIVEQQRLVAGVEVDFTAALVWFAS